MPYGGTPTSADMNCLGKESDRCPLRPAAVDIGESFAIRPLFL